ncbi:beta-galactosidase trimerization domain-containing protein, partial [Leuconostoc lactis]
WEGDFFNIHNYADLYELKGAKQLALYVDDFYADSAALTENNFGAGTAFMISARTNRDFLNKFYQMLINKFDLYNIDIPVEDINENINIQIRQDDAQKYFFITNYDDSEQTIVFNDNYIDMLSGNSLINNVTMSPYQVIVARKA